ncbi:MAG: STAS domain-containing protein [Legionellaceae bacterium]|nr:STAS domain-containing protein [Legionellaceae bacterium]
MKNDIVFKPSNELTFHTVQADRERLLMCLQDATLPGLHFDLSQVTHCDSAGLALLLEAKRLCSHYKRPFVIHDMSKEIHALAEFCGVEPIL